MLDYIWVPLTVFITAPEVPVPPFVLIPTAFGLSPSKGPRFTPQLFNKLYPSPGAGLDQAGHPAAILSAAVLKPFQS